MSLSLCLLFTAAMFSPTVPPDGPPVRADSLTGQLLIATPEMGDPRFRGAVILIVQHDDGGALGIRINFPLAERPMASVLQAIGQDGTGISGSVPIYSGGPVRPEVGFILHTADYHRPGTFDIDGRVAMTSSAEILLDIGHGHGPAKSLIAFGYAGWGPGQLDAEFAHGVWLTAPEDPSLVFDEDRALVWKRAMARHTVPL